MKMTQNSVKNAVKEHGTITAAAKFFGVSRGAVSQMYRGHGGARSIEDSIDSCYMLQALTTKPMRVKLWTE